MRPVPLVVVLLGVLSLGCALGKGAVDESTSVPTDETATTEPDLPEDLDLLVILDYGDSLADVRADLADHADTVVDTLQAGEDRWRVGVTTIAMTGDRGGSGTLVGAPVDLDVAAAAAGVEDGLHVGVVDGFGGARGSRRRRGAG